MRRVHLEAQRSPDRHTCHTSWGSKRHPHLLAPKGPCRTRWREAEEGKTEETAEEETAEEEAATAAEAAEAWMGAASEAAAAGAATSVGAVGRGKVVAAVAPRAAAKLRGSDRPCRTHPRTKLPHGRCHPRSTWWGHRAHCCTRCRRTGRKRRRSTAGACRVRHLPEFH